MPVFYQQDINNSTKIGIWKIDEGEVFFKEKVPLHRDVTHPHKRLQHLAGRFLLQYLYPQFPSHLIKIADTKKPFLPSQEYQFSISHCGDYAGAIVSKDYRVGMDIEIPSDKVARIQDKFMSTTEKEIIKPLTLEEFTQIWSAKESAFKWYGDGDVDFKQNIRLQSYNDDQKTFTCFFTKNNSLLDIHLEQFPGLCMTYICSPIK